MQPPNALTGPARVAHGVHLQHLARVQEAARRQSAETQAARDAAVANAADYISKIGKSE